MLGKLRALPGRKCAGILHGVRYFSGGEGGGGDWRLKRAADSTTAPQTSMQSKESIAVHGVLSEADVRSKAMKKALFKSNLVKVSEPQQQQQQQQQEPLSSGAPSFGQWFLSNAMMGAGMTLGFILAASLVRAVFGGGRSPAPHPSLQHKPPTDPSVTRI